VQAEMRKKENADKLQARLTELEKREQRLAKIQMYLFTTQLAWRAKKDGTGM